MTFKQRDVICTVRLGYSSYALQLHLIPITTASTVLITIWASQDRNYSERVMLIYDGLHYDALAVSTYLLVTLPLCFLPL